MRLFPLTAVVVVALIDSCASSDWCDDSQHVVHESCRLYGAHSDACKTANAKHLSECHGDDTASKPGLLRDARWFGGRRRSTKKEEAKAAPKKKGFVARQKAKAKKAVERAREASSKAAKRLSNAKNAVKSAASKQLVNFNKACWSHCNKKAGPCPWCGNGGMCCKRGVKEKGCDGSIGGRVLYSCSSPSKNFNKACWSHCNKKAGPCAWCGKDGVCCKRGVKEKGCDGSIGGRVLYSCSTLSEEASKEAKAKAAAALAKIAATRASKKHPHFRKPCWSHCNKKAGPCAWCGKGGVCCKRGVKEKGCDGSTGGFVRALCTVQQNGIGSSSCNGYKPADGSWKGKGGSCRKYGWTRPWCYVDKNFRGPGREFMTESKEYKGIYYAPCSLQCKALDTGVYTSVLKSKRTHTRCAAATEAGKPSLRSGGDICKKDTGGSCKWGSCYTRRGPTQCVDGKCLCLPGYCSNERKGEKQKCERSIFVQRARAKFLAAGFTRFQMVPHADPAFRCEPRYATCSPKREPSPACLGKDPPAEGGDWLFPNGTASWLDGRPDPGGCVSCPKGQFPVRHYLYHPDDTNVVHMHRNGRVLCEAPKSGPMLVNCYPTMFSAKKKEEVTGPTSCNALGIQRSWFWGTMNPKNEMRITVGCVVWKHVFCARGKKQTRSCATSKRVSLLYGDTCMKRRPDCFQQSPKQQCTPFDYRRCVGQKFGKSDLNLEGCKVTKEGKVSDSSAKWCHRNAKNDVAPIVTKKGPKKDTPYCVRTCEENSPDLDGFTFGRKDGSTYELPWDEKAPAIEVVEATTVKDRSQNDWDSVSRLIVRYLSGTDEGWEKNPAAKQIDLNAHEMGGMCADIAATA